MKNSGQNNAGYTVQFRGLGKNDFYTAFAAFVHKAMGDVLIARKAGGIHHKHHIPAAGLIIDLSYQILEAWAVGVLAALDSIREFLNDCQVARLRQRLQLATLCVY